jgi:hypothetical protein
MSRPDRSLRVILSIVALLLGANLLFALQSSTRVAAAAGGIPDSGAQMQAVIDQLAEMNKKVDKLQSFMESGKLTVKVAEKAEK